MTELRLGTDDASFTAYLATPSRPPRKWKGAVIVIHEVWGLVDHIRDVADRYAAEGYLALAPDLMGDLGISATVAAELQQSLSSADPEVRNAAQPLLRELMAPVAVPAFAASAITKLVQCVDHLEGQAGVDGRIGVVGYCFGGSYAFSLTVADPRVRASVPYYGYANLTQQLIDEISCPILYFVGHDDTPLMDALPHLTAQMRQAGITFLPVTYPGAGHAFFNDTNHEAYRAAAATDSWKKSLVFFEEALSHLN
ncbi:dienelactone hydrolase family protein [Subtercola sp. YIM 133946]|uniref:dienelactone hydrolase family protein n=1 Tax=Subtercola sp. YIM 133946 TaxID=3118909 RepID=UPI002F94D8D3